MIEVLKQRWLQRHPSHRPIPIIKADTLEVVVSPLESNHTTLVRRVSRHTDHFIPLLFLDLVAETARTFVDLAPEVSSRDFTLAAVMKVLCLFERFERG